MFRARALVLNIQKIRDQQIRIILFSYEYGRIHCWSKKEPGADIGNLVSVMLERKGNENHIHSIETYGTLQEHLTTYEEVTLFLTLIENLYKILPEGVEQRKIYTDIEKIFGIKFGMNNKIGIFQLIILLHIRIFKILGYLDKNAFLDSGILLYIFEHIDTRSIEQIFDGKILDDEMLDELHTIIEKTYHTLTYSA